MPTVDLGFWFLPFCSIAIAGDSPSIKSTSGFSNTDKNCLAYVERDSIYRRCPSANNVSNASDDLPEPDSPVMTTNLFFGMTRSTFFKLCVRAPLTVMVSIF